MNLPPSPLDSPIHPLNLPLLLSLSLSVTPSLNCPRHFPSSLIVVRTTKVTTLGFWKTWNRHGCSNNQYVPVSRTQDKYNVTVEIVESRYVDYGHLTSWTWFCIKVNSVHLAPSELPKYTCYSRVSYFGEEGQVQSWKVVWFTENGHCCLPL